MVAPLKSSGVLTEPTKYVEAADIYNPDVAKVTATPEGWNPANVSREDYITATHDKKLASEKAKEALTKTSTDITSAAGQAEASAKLDNFYQEKKEAVVEASKEAVSVASEYTTAAFDVPELDKNSGGSFLDETQQAMKDIVQKNGLAGITNDLGDSLYKSMASTTIGKAIDAKTNFITDTIRGIVNEVKGAICLPLNGLGGLGDSLHGSLLGSGMDFGIDGIIKCMEEMFDEPQNYLNTVVGNLGKPASRGDFKMLSEATEALGIGKVKSAAPDVVNKTVSNFTSGSIFTLGDQAEVPDQTPLFDYDPESKNLPDTARERTFIQNTLNAADPGWAGDKSNMRLDTFAAMSDDCKSTFTSDPRSDEAHGVVMADFLQSEYQSNGFNGGQKHSIGVVLVTA